MQNKIVLKYSEFNPIPYEVHSIVNKKIEENSKVLDIGCAAGYFAKELQKKNCKTWGVEMNREAAKVAEKYCEQVVVLDLEKEKKLPFKKGMFDYILFLDVLEHVRNSQGNLHYFSQFLKPDGKIVLSIPNIAHISMRLKLLLGNFDYEKKGIMDETHVHFYTRKTLQELIQKSGLYCTEIIYSSDFGQLPYAGRLLRKIPKVYQYLITRIIPTLLGVQFIAICTKRK